MAGVGPARAGGPSGEGKERVFFEPCLVGAGGRPVRVRVCRGFVPGVEGGIYSRAVAADGGRVARAGPMPAAESVPVCARGGGAVCGAVVFDSKELTNRDRFASIVVMRCAAILKHKEKGHLFAAGGGAVCGA